MKKSILILCLSGLFVSNFFSQEVTDTIIEENSAGEKPAHFSLSVEPLFGLKYGQLDEYVFIQKCDYDDDKLSELNWELKPELYYGLKLHGNWKSLFAETHLTCGIPGDSGQMIDSDWQNVGTANAQNYQYKTNYSESDNHLDYDISFGLKIGYNIFNTSANFCIRPTIAFDYNNIKFTGEGGTAWYGKSSAIEGKYYSRYDDKENQTVQRLSGRVIIYQRLTYYFWLGSDFSLTMPLPEGLKTESNSLSVNAGFFFTPYIYAVSYDAHLVTKTDFADLTVDFLGAFKFNFGLTYSFNERHSISLNTSYLYMRQLRGDDYYKSNYESNYNKSDNADGGAGASWFDINLSYKFKIF
ncbi:hypothetical protein [uncultured Treponema sp.]|uniref:hypothetical protein n=1 Tax=uncultured Treponema sp. TaxID=162155 RepID=UPI0025EC1C3D|nr:hypothetical protein [uncultured Treponema sp.]